MSAAATPAGANGAAEAAELRKAGADRPESQAGRGLAMAVEAGRNCGRTAEELRKLSAHPLACIDPAAGPLALVRMKPPSTREGSPPWPPNKAGTVGPLLAAEGASGEGGNAGSGGEGGARVLTHPAFARAPVANPRRRGPMGAVSLTRERQRRERTAREAEAAARRAAPPHELLPELLHGAPARAGGDRAAALAGDAAVIAEALALLDSRLRRPGEVFDSPDRVRAFLALHLASLDREEFRVMYLDGQHALIAFEPFGSGTLTQTAVYPREVVRRALALNAGAVILAHNHPSGNPEPSRADEMLTASLRQALALVDVRVLDHLIVGRLRVVSMAERGLM